MTEGQRDWDGVWLSAVLQAQGGCLSVAWRVCGFLCWLESATPVGLLHSHYSPLLVASHRPAWVRFRHGGVQGLFFSNIT